MPIFRANPFLALAAAGLTLAGCANLPTPTGTPQAEAAGRRLLRASAEAHGSAAFARLHDINVAYDGTWSSLIKRIQPALVDDQYRGGSDERLLLSPPATGQQHDGPAGSKHVFRLAPNEIRVWRNGAPDPDPVSRDAAALVVDSYRLFLLGPLLAEPNATAVEYAGGETIEGREYDRLLVTLAPGFGVAAQDQVELDIDQATHLLRRMRISLNGLATTRGAVAQVEVSDYVYVRGVAWPTHFVESLVRPIPGLPIHDWHLVGLDLDRGYGLADISGPAFAGAAVGRAGGR